MSIRSFNRARTRRLDRERRRVSVLQRKGRLAGATLGATALFAGTAQAATYTVTTTGDDSPTAPCTMANQCATLRDAITAANADSTPDTITFATPLPGTITLTHGVLPITGSGGLTINGPGAAALTVSGGGNSQIFAITASSSGSNSEAINGLTLSGGSTPNRGGAIGESTSGLPLSLRDDKITGSTSTNNGGGGGVYSDGPLTVSGTTVSGNVASAGSAGGIYARGRRLTLDRSIVSGNLAAVQGGGIESSTKYGSTITNSTISGNSALDGGGIEVRQSSPKYSPLLIASSTISNNRATHAGAGIEIGGVSSGNRSTIRASTISGNKGGPSSFGGGLELTGTVYGDFRVIDATISGNSAASGGGVSLGGTGTNPLLGSSSNSAGSISFENSTIASNAATGHGGGIYLGQYSSGSPAAKHSGTVTVSSTDVSGNAAHGAGNDLERAAGSTSGGFNGAFSLIQQPGNAPLTKQSVIVGVDPQLGPLASNGGPTQTRLPSGTSALIDQGHAPNGLTTDQRGAPRTVDTSIPNPPGGDGTDIGAVELPSSSVVGISFGVSIAGKPLGGSARLLIAGRATPVLCRVRASVIASCVVKVRVGKKLVASGSSATTHPTGRLSLRIKPTSDGLAMLTGHPLGIKATATAVASAPGSPTVTGKIRLLAGPSITLPTGSHSSKLSEKVRSELDRVASLLDGVRRVTCTAYTDQSNGDVSLTKDQAKAACKRLKRDGLKAKYKSVGQGHTGGGGQRKLVISFTY